MSIGQNPPFQLAASYYFATSTASSSNAIVANGDVAVVTNISSGNLYIQFGSVAISASVGSGYCVPANSQRVITLPPNATWQTAILDASSGHAYIEMGRGSAR